MNEKVEIKLTKKQMELLKPLFDEANSKPMQGGVIGQAWQEYKKAAFQFVTPKELRVIIKQAEAKAKGEQ